MFHVRRDSSVAHGTEEADGMGEEGGMGGDEAIQPAVDRVE